MKQYISMQCKNENNTNQIIIGGSAKIQGENRREEKGVKKPMEAGICRRGNVLESKNKMQLVVRRG